MTYTIGYDNLGNPYMAPNPPVIVDPKEVFEGPAPTPAGTENQSTPPDRIAEVIASYPWAAEFPDLIEQILGWIEDELTPDEIVNRVRQTNEHKQRFPWFYKPDGSVRFPGGEAEYIREENSLRQVMRQYGAPGYDYDDPTDFRAFFELDIDGQELEARFQLYDSISQSGRDVQDAYFIYAGMDVTTDDLYDAVVNPERQQALVREYQERVALNPPSFDEFIDRLTTVSMNRVVGLVRDLADNGLVATSVVEQIQSADPNQARQIVGALYLQSLAAGTPQEDGLATALAQGVGPDGYQAIGAITHAFKLAMVGSAAQRSGLEMPSIERLDFLISAGVDRAKALAGYSTIAQKSSEFRAMALRANIALGAEDIEDAVLLDRRNGVISAIAREDALGQKAGAFGTFQDRQGRFIQPGLRAPGS